MNAMGMMLAGSIARATVFAIAGAFAYLAIRRRGPAAGSLAAAASLAIMAMVSVAALSPWPRWWTVGGVDRPAPEAAPAPRDARSGPSSSEAAAPARPRMEPPPTAGPSLLDLFLDELRKPSGVREAKGWGWREWLAAGFVACLALGAARLGIGLWGISRLRARSLAVEDVDLDELIAVLRAELAIAPVVEVREAAELTTPATIGWRRPVVLLPADWRAWDQDERRAVLAHELAHVRRGDFLAGVAAQVAVALQFYHPMAHWLSARLRLEQELAADAWGARLSGGASAYLSALARLALRRDGPAPNWPARAFLPSHGTFARRIEMLKNRGPIRPDAPPPAARFLTVGALVAVGLLVAGLRGPVGDSPAQAQGRPVEKPAPVTPSEAHELIFVPEDARMVVSLRPASLVRRRDVARLLESIGDRHWLRNGYPVPLEEIEQVVAFWGWEPGYDGPEILPPPSGAVVRTSKPQDWRAVLGKLGGPTPADSRFDGEPYTRLDPGSASPSGVYTPDDRTMVVAEEGVLREIIADRRAPIPARPWDEAWKRADRGQLMLALDTRWLRRQIARIERRRPPETTLTLETFAPLFEKARSYAVSLGASDQSLSLSLVAGAGSPEDARPVAETMQAVLTLGKNAIRGYRRDATRRSEALDWALQAIEAVVAGARVETDERFVSLRSTARVDLAEGITSLAPAISRANSRARRDKSVINLKTIGLALHQLPHGSRPFPGVRQWRWPEGPVPA